MGDLKKGLDTNSLFYFDYNCVDTRAHFSYTMAAGVSCEYQRVNKDSCNGMHRCQPPWRSFEIIAAARFCVTESPHADSTAS